MDSQVIPCKDSAYSDSVKNMGIQMTKLPKFLKSYEENEQHEFKIFYYRQYIGSVWGKNIREVDKKIKNKSFEWLCTNASTLNREINGTELKKIKTSRMMVYEQSEKSYYFCIRCNTIRPEHFFVVATQ